ncbi:MAG: tRNA (adenosine(37)-N6)-threonylcarbamoyltransferase complex dimerization subunit type 1 TsaB [Oscillospiraceae bacterium]
MLTLAFESSAKSASVALMCDGKLLGQYYQNSGLTHSRTLLPMAEDMLKNLDLKLSDIDLFAVSRGPGSFTGIRIGVAAVKGLAWALDKPVCGVSTLEAMANLAISAGEGTIVCCAMDARRNQVYNALFGIENGKPKRLTPDRAISVDALRAEIEKMEQTPYLVGDGAALCHENFTVNGLSAILAPEPVRNQSAWGVAVAAQTGEKISADDLSPVYLRLSQAERERNERLGLV